MFAAANDSREQYVHRYIHIMSLQIAWVRSTYTCNMGNLYGLKDLRRVGTQMLMYTCTSCSLTSFNKYKNNQFSIYHRLFVYMIVYRRVTYLSVECICPHAVGTVDPYISVRPLPGKGLE